MRLSKCLQRGKLVWRSVRPWSATSDFAFFSLVVGLRITRESERDALHTVSVMPCAQKHVLLPCGLPPLWVGLGPEEYDLDFRSMDLDLRSTPDFLGSKNVVQRISQRPKLTSGVRVIDYLFLRRWLDQQLMHITRAYVWSLELSVRILILFI